MNMKTLTKILKFIQGHPVKVLSMLVILLGLTIYFCFQNYILKHKLSRYQPKINSSVQVVSTSKDDKGKEVKQTTNITATDNKFSITPSYTGTTSPNQILYWESNIRPSSTGDNDNTVQIKDSTGNNTCDTGNPLGNFYFRDFMPTDYLPESWKPSNDSLVQFLLDRQSLELSFYNQGVQKYLTKSYSLNLERYKYNWTPSSGLTYDKKYMFEISPYISARYQIFNKVPIIGTGIQFKTRNIDYNFGISSTYDERFNKPFRIDAEISLTYKFKRWLK